MTRQAGYLFERVYSRARIAKTHLGAQCCQKAEPSQVKPSSPQEQQFGRRFRWPGQLPLVGLRAPLNCCLAGRPTGGLMDIAPAWPPALN